MAKLTEAQVAELFERYAATGDLSIRNRLLEHYLYVAQIVAKKFIGRGVEYEDLLQVASMALVKAIERFEPARGIKFTSFATPSLIGEIKNYFRDKTRLLHISRRDSEQLIKLHDAREALAQRVGVSPADLAQHMGVSVERVLELLEIQQSVAVASLDSYAGEDESTTLRDMIGAEDMGFQAVEQNDLVHSLFACLNEDEKTIIRERFWHGKSQKQIAEQLGVSQMHISRSEKKILQKLRTYYNAD